MTVLSCRYVVAATLFVVAVASLAQAQSGSGAVGGSALFGLYCATCHGTSARGDGPLAAMMNKKPADLTLIARRHGGAFPADIVARTIDGRSPAKGHGGGDMPVWGDAFAKSKADATPVDEKIGRLVAYLETIQAK